MQDKPRSWKFVLGLILALFVIWVLVKYFVPDLYDSLPSLWDLQNPRLWGRIFTR